MSVRKQKEKLNKIDRNLEMLDEARKSLPVGAPLGEVIRHYREQRIAAANKIGRKK